jgi:predicted neutral ceramidase superfamily lipid hydrolase
MYGAHEKRLYALIIGACVLSILLGVSFGYLIFSGTTVNANIYAHTKAGATVPVVSGSVNEVVSAVASATGEAVYPNTDSYRYIVTVVDGYVTVFYADHFGGTMKEMTNLPANALPVSDIERLTEGIRIYTEEALERILQDYGS